MDNSIARLGRVLYARGVRWERFFDDLEDQLASEWEAERAALDTEAERLRLSRVELRERLSALIDRDRSAPSPTLEFLDGQSLAVEVAGVGADWVALTPVTAAGVSLLAPLGAILGVGLPHADALRSARPAPPRSALTERLTFGFALRDLVRKRSAVTVWLATGRTLTGTIDRAGADHFDLAIHDAGTPRRVESVTGFRLIPFAAVARVRVEAGTSLL